MKDRIAFKIDKEIKKKFKAQCVRNDTDMSTELKKFIKSKVKTKS